MSDEPKSRREAAATTKSLTLAGRCSLILSGAGFVLGALVGFFGVGAVRSLHSGQVFPWIDRWVGDRASLPFDAYYVSSFRVLACFVGALILLGLVGVLVSEWKRLERWVRGLAIFAGVNVVVVTGLLVGVDGTPLAETDLDSTGRFLVARESDDSWMPMFQALQVARSGSDQLLYQEIFFERGKKFQYPPTSLLVTAAIKRISPPDSYPQNKRYYLKGISRCFSWLSVLITALAAWRILALGRKRFGIAAPPVAVEGLLVAVLAITFYPVAASYAFGQVQTWINALFAVTIWCWMEHRRALAGVLVGGICLLKPQLAVLVVWGILRRHWEFVRAAVVVAVAGLAVSVLIFGIANHWDYLSVLRFLSKHGESYYPNQSVNGIVNRLLHNGDGLQWSRWFPPFHPVVYASTLATSIALLIAALWRPRNGGGGAVDLAIVALSATMASPIAWEHHYGILLPLYAILLPALVARPNAGVWALPVLASSYFLTSHLLPPLNRLASAPNGLSIFQAHLFAGALIALALLYRLRQRDAPAGAPAHEG